MQSEPLSQWKPGGPEHPVEQVSWDDVQEFLKKLNAKESESGWLYRLPTEAEWEYACRGATPSQKDCAFDFYFDEPTNDITTNLANFNNELKHTSKVGSYKPNVLGLYDMHGNVWEWCDDNVFGGSDRVFRGGSWDTSGRRCQAADRGTGKRSLRSFHVGFRLARVRVNPSVSQKKTPLQKWLIGSGIAWVLLTLMFLVAGLSKGDERAIFMAPLFSTFCVPIYAAVIAAIYYRRPPCPRCGRRWAGTAFDHPLKDGTADWRFKINHRRCRACGLIWGSR